MHPDCGAPTAHSVSGVTRTAASIVSCFQNLALYLKGNPVLNARREKYTSTHALAGCHDFQFTVPPTPQCIRSQFLHHHTPQHPHLTTSSNLSETK
jgi:hypothetical protein